MKTPRNLLFGALSLSFSSKLHLSSHVLAPLVLCRIWFSHDTPTMVFHTKFSLQSFLKQVHKLTQTQRNSITQVGFGHLLQIPSHVLRRTQLIELMETWNNERQSFIFPPGDITITLLDVVLILGLRVIGQPVILKEDTPLTTLELEFGASIQNRFITVDSLKDRLESLGERADSSFVRVFLLYCFGTLLFTSGNGKVDSRYLLFLEDLDYVSSFAWGAAVREDLHECLTQWKSKRTNSVRGCLILLQIWSYEHIVIGRPKLLDCLSTFPRVCRWESSGRQYLPIKFEELDHTQILRILEPTSEEIQIDIVKEIPQEWYLRSEIGTMEEPINIESERCMKMVRVYNLEQKEEEEEEEPMMQQKSTIFVLSDDDDSNSMKDLKEEVLELKAIVEEQNKEKEVMKKEIEELRILVEKLQSDIMLKENSISDMKNKIEESKILVEKLQSEEMLENSILELERIVSEYEFDL
ncbi:unnamed protein product [Lactuca saligna]|uniref:Aminotransferase-like plant mobile domain-containing protein n=1 Tax=Lactuca saligna TaxID=75948 RepID=A0AA36EMH6_LACSI|nr:unnamed protein product [Lactuca saligna]